MNQRLDGARILVIDDHADLVDNLREILEEEGANVQTATSAADGIDAAHGGFDVALVDVRLPDGRGPELVPELKLGDGLQEVLLVTGHASIADAVEAVRTGAFAYVLKPFDSEDLVSMVGRAVAQVRLRRRTAELQLQVEQREAALRTLVDTVQALLVVFDERGIVVQANPAVAAATGVSLESILGRNWVETFVPTREHAVIRELFQSMVVGNTGASLETALLRRATNGEVEERTISWRLSSLRVESSVRIYASGLDITDLRELERRTRLAEKLAAVGTVSAGLAHEIRNPLNAATLQLELLERRMKKVGEDPKLIEPIDTVRQEITRLSHLVSDFLAFARPNALNLASRDLTAVARQVASLVQPVAQARNIAFGLHAPEHPVQIELDVERIKQVLLNLIHNAMDAAAGRVDVRVEPDGAGARLVVADDGPGIPREIEGRIFEPFFTTKEQGTGLGMAIAHKIIDLHGGQIRVDGRSGAVFTISLPRRVPRLR